MDKLIAKLCESHEHAPGQHNSLEDAVSAHPSSCSSLPITPATDTFNGTAPTTRPASAAPNDRVAAEELLRLKLELAKAQNHISRVEQELAQTRREHESGRVTPVLSSDSDFTGGAPLVEPIGTKPTVNPSLQIFPKPPPPRDTNWQAPVPDDCRSDISDALSATGFNRSRAIWNNGNKPGGHQNSFLPPPVSVQDAGQATNWSHSRNQGFMDQQNMPPYPGPSMDGYRSDRYSHEADLMRSGSGRRGSRYDNRFGGQSYGSSYGGYNIGNMSQNQYDHSANYGGGGTSNMPGGGMAMFPQYGQQPVGSPLSPHATEFTSATGPSWKPDVSLNSGSMVDVCCASSLLLTRFFR